MSMDRRSVLKVFGSAAAVALTGGLGRTSRAAAPENFLDRVIGGDNADPLTPQLAKVRVGIRKVAENLYVLLGAGGNIGLLDGPDGAIVVDSGYPDRAKDVAAAVRVVAKNPANLLINTHYHFDHTGSNEALQAAGCRIVGHDNTRKHLSERVTIDFLQMTSEPRPMSARPTVTFGDRLSLHANGETIQVVHVAPAHTDSDAYVLFEKAGVLQTGDLFFGGFFPFIDYSTGGSLHGMIAAEEQLLGIVDDKMRLIPGHGAVTNKAGLQTELDMLKTVRDRMEPLMTSGKSLEEVLAAKPLASLDDPFGKGFLDTETFTKLIYMCYTKGTK